MRFSWRVAAVVLLGAALASAISTSLARQVSVMRGYEPDTVALAILNASFWFGWVLLAIPLVALSSRLRLERNPRVAVPVHLVVALLTAVTHVAIQTTVSTFEQANHLASKKPDEYLAFSWSAYWLEWFPLTLIRLIDWELIAAFAIIGVSHAFFYYRETQHRALLNAQLETRLVAAHLQTLQSQLHPHFLFNTLHAISVLMHRDVAAADRMLIRLSDLLRMTLDAAARPEIRLSEEMDFLSKYLQIEQVRLGDRLTLHFDVDNDVLDAMVPALVLQPLVENAIKHGIAPHTGPGRIAVSARAEGEMLVMTVSDTGPGPNERAMASLSTGIGVSNTRARLTTKFGARFRFEFQRHRDNFTVLVAIPFRQETAPPQAVHVA
jgi:two-component system, LytTR family, sensor kinase